MDDGAGRARVAGHVCLSSIDWGYLWQGQQELMARLARAGARVLFVENTGVRAVRPSDWPRLVDRLRAGSRELVGSRRPLPGIELLAPLVLPFPWSGVARRLNRVAFADRLPALAARRGLRAPVVWSFLPTPLAIDTIRAFRSSRSAAVYYCVADFEAISDRPASARAAELELLREVDLVLAGARTLRDRLSRHHDRVVLAPFSVGDVFFEPPRPTPPDLARIPRPRIGYVGGLHRHVDGALLREVFRSMPSASFVFVGPDIGEHAAALYRGDNVHLLGRRPPEDLPSYIDGFDVCIVPYVISDFTRSVAPMKFHEYLARGKPVVSTPLPEVLLLGYDDGIVRVAGTSSEFAAALTAAIADGSRAEERRALARGYSWAVLFERIRAELRSTVSGAGVVV